MSDLRVKGSVQGGLELAFNTLAKHLRGVEDALLRAEERIPRAVSFRASDTSGSSGNLLLNINPGGPPLGYLWHVMAWRVSGNTGTGTPGGTAYAYVGSRPVLSQADIPANWVDKTSTAFPVPAFYQEYQLTVVYPQKLYFLITAPTASTVYEVSGTAKQVLDTLPNAREQYGV